MAKISQGCIDTALEALGRFDAEELKDYVRNVFNRARDFDSQFSGAAMQRAIREINDETMQSYFDDAMRKTRNIGKFNKIVDLFKKGVSLPEVLIQRHKNLDYNIEAAQRSARMRLHQAFVSELTPEEFDYVIKGKNDIDIARAIDRKEASAMAKKIASAHEKYLVARTAESVTSDALPLDFINKDRHFRAIHNTNKIINAGRTVWQRAKDLVQRNNYTDSKILWKQAIIPKLDLLKTFAGTDAVDLNGKIDMQQVDSILNDVFRNITEGKSNIFTRSAVANDKKSLTNLSKRFFEWKDMESFMQYNQQYGHDSYFNALMADIEGSSSKIGMANIFGGNAQNMYVQLRKELFDAGNTKQLKGIRSDLYYKQVSGQNNLVAHPTLATMGSNIRTYSSMAKLGRLAIQSMTDVTNNIMFAKEFGYDYYKAYTNTLSGMFDLLPNEERKYMADLFKINVQSHMGYTGKFIDAQATGDITRKVSNFYYHKIGMEAWDQSSRTSAITMMGRHLFNMSERTFEELNPETQNYFKKFNVTKNEWEMLRKKNKGSLFTVDNVTALSDENIKKLYADSDKLIALKDMRNYVYNKVYAMFDTASSDSILAPNAFARAWCTLGLQPGTLPGEVVRFMMQFKAFPLRFIDRYWASFRNADSAMAKLAFGIQFLAASIPMSLISQTVDNAAQGKSMPDISKMNYNEAVRFSIGTIASGLGTFQRVLNPSNQNKNLFMNLLNTPSMQMLGDTGAIPLSLFTGNIKGFKKSLKDVSQDIAPIGSLPIVTPIIRKMMGEKPYLQPGQKQYFGA